MLISNYDQHWEGHIDIIGLKFSMFLDLGRILIYFFSLNSSSIFPCLLKGIVFIIMKGDFLYYLGECFKMILTFKFVNFW